MAAAHENIRPFNFSYRLISVKIYVLFFNFRYLILYKLLVYTV